MRADMQNVHDHLVELRTQGMRLRKTKAILYGRLVACKHLYDGGNFHYRLSGTNTFSRAFNGYMIAAMKASPTESNWYNL
jgi:hypothetical protein